MTTTFIIEIISIATLLLLALPGTQLLWNWEFRKYGNKGIGEYGNMVTREYGKMETGEYVKWELGEMIAAKKSVIKKLSVEEAKLAGSIF